MGTSKRYSEYYDRIAAEKLANSPQSPCTLPQQAYGPNPIEWAKKRPSVWVWITWPEGPATRIAAFAKGWNDRVVIVEWYSERGQRDTVVWRNAVTRRAVNLPP